MPRVSAESETCKGYGNCVIAAPDYFDIDNAGVVMVLKADVPEGSRGYVEAAARSCPVSALRIEESV